MSLTIVEALQLSASHAEHWDLPSLEGFALARGRQFRPVPLPTGVTSGEPKNCFTNSVRVVLEADDDMNYRYVEGYVWKPNLPVLIHHGWVTIDGEDVAIDPTLATPTDYEYWGIDFQTDYVLDVSEQHNLTGMTLQRYARDLMRSGKT